MKMGEAKERLHQIQQYLSDSLVTLESGPITSIGDVLDRCNTLVIERRNLDRRVRDTEDTSDIGGESIREVVSALEALDTKITFLERIALRSDLSAPQCVPLFTQLETYRNTRDTLRLSLTKCLWEFELVE
jgi:hypothetical protein